MQLKDILKEKHQRHGKVTKGALFLHDNAPDHGHPEKLAYLGFQCLNHPPFSPDWAPSDYHQFPVLKKAIESFLSNVEDITAAENW